MTHRTCATICTGGGLADVGLLQAGLRPVWGVEIDPRRAAHAHRALAALGVEDWTCYGDLLGLDPQSVPGVDVIHASLPCTNYSAANPAAAKREGGRATDHDLALAQAVVGLLSIWRHRATRLVTFEQVPGWQGSPAHTLVVEALHHLGYQTSEWVSSAADFGVPQTRRRLWLVARRGSTPRQPAPTHASPGHTRDLFTRPWVGWETVCPDWQSLPARQLTERYAALLRHVARSEPSVTKNHRAKLIPDVPLYSNSRHTGPRDVLLAEPRQRGEVTDEILALGGARCPVEGDEREDGTRWRLPIYRHVGQPAPALTVTGCPQVVDASGARSMTSRHVARLMGLPDEWPCPRTLAETHEICGLGVCPPVIRAVVEANL